MPVPAAAPTTAPFSGVVIGRSQAPTRQAATATANTFVRIILLPLRSRRRGVRLLPLFVRIEERDLGRALRRLVPEIALIDFAALVHDERHHAGLAVLH